MGPTGNIVQGHILDSARAPLERKMKEIDPLLYFKWNPKKLKRWGLWEIRRRPEEKCVKDIAKVGETHYLLIDSVENNFENHIMDVPFLNYEIIEKLKKMDTWQHSYRGQNFLSDMDSRAESHKERTEEKIKSERKYELKQQKTAIRDLMNYTLSGGDPSQIANHWGKSGSQN
jgi:hypothetical protein